MNIKISHYILLSFLFILTLFSATTLINYRLSEAVNANERYLSRSTDIIRNTGRFQRNLLNMVSGLRGYLLTGEMSFVEAYDNSDRDNEIILQELSGLVSAKSQRDLLADIMRLNKKWTEEYTEPLRTAKMLSNKSDSNLNQLNQIYKEKYLNGAEKEIQEMLQEQFKAFSNFEYKLREERIAILAQSVKDTRKASFSLTILSIVVSSVVVGFLIKKISSRILNMTKMANSIAAGNYEVNVVDAGRDELSSLGHSLNHMASELSKNISLLKKSNAELDQFAHIVSHDMKGPLRGIAHVVSWIEEDHIDELTPKVNEYIQIIKRRIFRAENLIQGLLSYARIGKEDVEKESVSVTTLIEEVLDNLAVDTNTDVTITVGLPNLCTEKLMLYQVFANLISNAIKYNDKERCLIKISHKEHENKHEFFVKDNGQGIAQTYFDRIFVIFQTLNNRDNFESTGVGLAIVKKILDGKKQHIRVTSEPGTGSTFAFTWPKN